MSDRPLGISIVCVLLVLFGLSSLLGGLGLFSLWSVMPPGQPLSVQTFVSVAPFFMLGMGALAAGAGVALWHGHPLGLRLALAWLGLWVVEEVLLGVWGAYGPAIVRRVGDGVASNALRVLIAGALAYYLLSAGRRYVGRARTEPTSKPF
ncbi:MAG: hypothetical protein ABEJ42_05920 [Halobacteriaceae archaeon]